MNLTNIVVCICLLSVAVIIVMVVCIWDYVRGRRQGNDISEGLDINHDYGLECFDNGVCEVRDTTDYYFDEKDGDIAEIKDTNEYYSYDDQ